MGTKRELTRGRRVRRLRLLLAARGFRRAEALLWRRALRKGHTVEVAR